VAGNNAAAHRLRAELLERLAAQSTNGVARNIYREAAAEERH
jgi:alkyl sulfatase BDS1-like metallo-beta-lactamase superfamily hydrolase